MIKAQMDIDFPNANRRKSALDLIRDGLGNTPPKGEEKKKKWTIPTKMEKTMKLFLNTTIKYRHASTKMANMIMMDQKKITKQTMTSLIPMDMRTSTERMMPTSTKRHIIIVHLA